MNNNRIAFPILFHVKFSNYFSKKKTLVILVKKKTNLLPLLHTRDWQSLIVLNLWAYLFSSKETSSLCEIGRTGWIFEWCCTTPWSGEFFLDSKSSFAWSCVGLFSWSFNVFCFRLRQGRSLKVRQRKILTLKSFEKFRKFLKNPTKRLSDTKLIFLTLTQYLH